MMALRIFGVALATLGFAILTLALLVYVAIYVIALFQGDRDTAPWIFAVAAIVFLALSGLSALITRLCARRFIELVRYVGDG